jgi:hypothetical protein
MSPRLILAPRRVKYSEIIADNLSKAGWSWGSVSAADTSGRTIWIADAHRENGKRFVVHADERLTAFLELESATRAVQPLACSAWLGPWSGTHPLIFLPSFSATKRIGLKSHIRLSEALLNSV